MACPSDDDLSSYLAGRIGAGDAAAIEAHVAACRMCEALVEVLGTRSPLASAPTLAAPSARPTGSTEPRAGDAIGRYVLQHKVGAGGMGVVWAAYDPELDRVVALKLMRDAAAHLRARFEREVRITARLQHPSIVHISEAGRWQGEPYYVMRLVRGESLDRLLGGGGARDELAARLAMLPAVIAVVDALAYAHGAGVIHRDLKPENVLVGEFGEAVVIDWGLAKALAEPRRSEPELAAGSGDGGTVAGSVIGTPAYMPPEQARGEVVDARADVYALGAILYFLLAGSRPYASARPDGVVAAVLAGPPAPLPAGVPAELATIAARAMAREPADRYPTAKELAEDLKRFQTGQLVASHRYTAGQLVARWVRRHRAAVAVGGIALAVLATSGALGVRRILDERARATEQEQRAEAQRAEVERLLTFMLVDLQGQLAPIGKVPLLEKVAAQAEDYFATPRASDGDPHVRLRALVAVGDVLSAKGDAAQARVRYLAAEQVARIHLAVAPADLAWRHDLAQAESRTAALLEEMGDLPGAVARLREALAITTQLAHDDPGETRDRDVAGAHDLLGGALETEGEIAGALAEQRESLALEERLLAQAPEGVEQRRAVALQHVRVGQLRAARGDLAGGIAEIRQAVAMMTSVVAADPAAAERVRDLATFHASLGRLLNIQGDREAALAEFRTALAEIRPVADREPENIKLRVDVADDLDFIASAEASPQTALAACREARTIREALAARDPARAQWQEDLQASALEIAVLLQQLGRHTEALPEARSAVALGEKLVARDPANTDWQGHLIQAYGVLGETFEDLDQRDDALAAQRAGLAIAAKLAAADPKQVEWQDDVMTRRVAIGDLLAHVDRTAAIAEYKAALAIAEQLAALEPKNPRWTESVGYLRDQLAR